MCLDVRLPEVKPEQHRPPQTCPHADCPGTRFYRHGREQRRIQDLEHHSVLCQRYKCRSCGRTFYAYPPGIGQAQQSERLKAMSVLLYVLGLSYGAAADFLRASGVQIGKSSVYNNVQAAGQVSRQRQKAQLRAGVKRSAIGADATYLKVKGEWIGVEVVVDDQTDELLGLELVVSEKAEEIRDFIHEIAQAVAAEVLVTDDFDSYKQVADSQSLAHQICQSHIIRNIDALTESIQSQLEPPSIFRRRGVVSNCPQLERDLQTLLWLVRDCPQDATQFLAHLYERYRHEMPL